VPEERVLEAALERARPLAGKAGGTLGAIKEQMYARPLALLRGPG
jgi:enoyl-CoA hydratase/carnithine racemase